jgi:hypothetical protein
MVPPSPPERRACRGTLRTTPARSRRAARRSQPGAKREDVRLPEEPEEAVPEGGGYVTEEELEREQERYLTDIRKLRALPRSRVPLAWPEGYWLAHLKRNTPTSMLTLRTSGVGIGSTEILTSYVVELPP